MRATPGLALRVAWDLFRIPLLHRGIGRAVVRRRAGRSTGEDRPTASQPDSGPAAAPARLARAALPIVAILVFGVVLGATLWAASGAGTLGFDFLAYHQAANRVLAGERAVRPGIQQTGGFGLFYYPPPFVFAILPFAPLDPAIATWSGSGCRSRRSSWASR